MNAHSTLSFTSCSTLLPCTLLPCRTQHPEPERLHAELESRLTPEQIQAVKAQAQKQSIEQVIGQVLGQAR